MTILSLQFLGTLFLISTSVWMCLTESPWESPVCDQESVYHYYSKSCFRLFNVSMLSLSISSCNNYSVGEYHTVNGTVALVFGNLETFLRAYLQYLRVPRAVVQVYSFFMSHRNPMYKFIQKAESCSFYGRKNMMGLFAISLAEALGTPLYWEGVGCGYEGQVVCRADGSGNVSEASSCPSNITVESVSDSNVTLYITPGKTKTQVKVRFNVYKPCINLTSSLCEEPVTSLDKKVFLVKPTTLTVLKLEPSTRYRAQFEIEGYKGIYFKCNETVDFTTDGVRQAQQGEENSDKGEVAALSVLLVCSLCVSIVQAILYYKLRKSTGQDNICLFPVRLMMHKKDNQPKEATKVNFKAKATANAYSCSGEESPSNVGKDNKSQNKRDNEEFGTYTNVQVTAPIYDVAENEQDAHVYEM